MRRLIFALSVSGMVSGAFAAPANDLAARTELHAIDTLTLPDAQFLSGDANARKTVTTGTLRIPGREGRLPVVLLQHGSGGIAANVEMWSRELNALGVSTLALDGFTGRGLTSVNTNQALLGRLNFVLDVYRALDVLAKHPRVDPQRIALMGFSRGGQAALYASLKRFHKMWNAPASSSRPTFRSIPIARLHSSPIPKSLTGRSASSAVCRTTTIRSHCARHMSQG